MIRIGIDTGGTFTDIVCGRRPLGRHARHQGREHAGQSGDRPGARRRGRSSRATGGRRRRRRRARARHHRRDQRAAAGRDRLARPDRHRGLPPHPRDRAPVGARGLRQFLLLGEAASASCRCAACARSAAGSIFAGEELRPLDEASVRAAAQFFRSHGIRAIGVCLIHSYANPAHERRVAEILAEEYPDCTRVALLRRAARVPRIRARGDDAGRRLRQAAHGALPRARRSAELGAGLARQAVPGDAVERRRGERRADRATSRSRPRCRARRPARSAAP